MIAEVFQAIIGLLFSLLVPGLLIVEIFYDDMDFLAKTAMSIMFSVATTIGIGILLGYSRTWAAITGGLTFNSIAITQSIIVSILLVMLVVKNLKFKKIKPKKDAKLKGRSNRSEHIKKSKIAKTNMPNMAAKRVGKTHKSKNKISNLPSLNNKFFNNIIKDKGLLQFIIRSAIFATIVFGIYFFIFTYFRHTQFFINHLKISDSFYFDFMSGLRKRDLINATLFAVVIFIIWNRNNILKLKPYLQDKKQTIIAGTIALASLFSHYYLKYWINSNQELALQNALAFTIAKNLFNIFFILFLAIAVYNSRFIKEQFLKFKRQIPVFAGVLVAYFFMIQIFNNIWRVFGNFASRSVYSLLSLTFSNAYLSIRPDIAPRLGVGDFIVAVSNECSGIDSLLLFISLYVVLLLLDWNKMDRKRMYILFIPGIIGTIFYNVLRIYLLIIVGVFISPEFAVDMFHSNIGWILFLLFFIGFWHFGSKWVYQKDRKEQ